MDNHYHLLVETPEANLSRAMRQLNGVYTQAFNRRHRRVGHVLQGRFKAIVVVVLWAWLSRAESRLTAVSLGLIIGGAVGNAIDRLAHGAVVDFALLHITTASFSFNWYVFNLADVAIVAGVAGLLYETLLGGRAAKAP